MVKKKTQDNDVGNTASSNNDKPESNEETKETKEASTGNEAGHNPELNAGVTKNTNEAKTDVAFEENKGALSKTDEKTRDKNNGQRLISFSDIPDPKSLLSIKGCVKSPAPPFEEDGFAISHISSIILSS